MNTELNRLYKQIFGNTKPQNRATPELKPADHRPCDEGTERPLNETFTPDKAVQLKSTPLPVPIKEKASDLKEPEASNPEFFPLQEERPDPQSEDKPIAGAKSTKKPSSPFDFAKEHEAYEARRIKGNQEMQRILSALTDKRARDYVNLYFASASVMWNVENFKKRIAGEIVFWKSLRDKYGDGKITNYSRSIETGELILETLKKLY